MSYFMLCVCVIFLLLDNLFHTPIARGATSEDSTLFAEKSRDLGPSSGTLVEQRERHQLYRVHSRSRRRPHTLLTQSIRDTVHAD